MVDDTKADENTRESIDNGKKGNVVSSTLKRLLSNGVILAIVYWIFTNFFAWPIINYNKTTEEFTVSNTNTMRAVSMYVRPQMVIRYNNSVVLLIHMVGLYEHEVVYFSDGRAALKRNRGTEAEELMAYLHKAIIDRFETLYEMGQIDYAAQEIADGLHIYISLVCGIKFQPELGNKPDAFCMVENDGVIVDCLTDSSYIEERLCDYEIRLDDANVLLGDSAEVNSIVDSVTKEVENIHDSKSEVDR